MNTIYKTLLFIAILSLMACNAEKEVSQVNEVTEKESTGITVSKEQFKASGMIDGQLKKKQFDKVISVNGKINLPSKNRAIVSSIISGTVGKIDLLKGQWIKKGQPLFTLTNPELIDLQEEFLVLQSKVEYLKEEVQRKQKLVEENLTPKQELLLAQSNYQTNQARHKALEQKLKIYGIDVNVLSVDKLKSSLTIYSPISGYVSNINAFRGQYIDPSTEVIVLDNKSNSYLELNVLEQDGFLISKGQEITFTVSGSPSKLYQATIYLINPSVNDNGMVTVHCRIIDNKNLLPGMYATANLILESYENFGLPEEAIVQLGGKNHILIKSKESTEQDVYIPTSVKVGAKEKGFVEVINSDDFINKVILVKGGYYLVN